MTKKLLVLQLAAAFILVQGGLALAANPDNGPGCGLGKLVWSEYKHQKNIAPQVLMATTNTGFGVLFTTQTFAISSGTSGCTNDGVVMAEHKAEVFAASNFEGLSQDMAQGRGEHLASLATLMGVPVEQQPAFFALSQERYRELLQAGQTSTAAMLTALHDAMAQHPVLAKVSTR
ncbi:MAG: DUF3015 domain-containing protein [Nitrospirae bacterium]|nr:MAG: DUF3015 domain-containing protein [Nitrospirota bacterium]